MTTIRHRINTFILSIVFQSLSSMKIFNQSKSTKCVDVRQCKHKDGARLQDVLQMLIVPSDRVKDLVLYKLSFTTQLKIFRIVNIIRRIIYAFFASQGFMIRALASDDASCSYTKMNIMFFHISFKICMFL